MNSEQIIKNPKETDPESGVPRDKRAFDTIIPSLDPKEQYQKKEIRKTVVTYSMKTMMDIIFVLCLL